MGVRQGENLSPLLFALYLNDFELSMSKKIQGLSFLSNLINKHLSNEDVEYFVKKKMHYYMQMIPLFLPKLPRS